jgi:hypothetical protein
MYFQILWKFLPLPIEGMDIYTNLRSALSPSPLRGTGANISVLTPFPSKGGSSMA